MRAHTYQLLICGLFIALSSCRKEPAIQGSNSNPSTESDDQLKITSVNEDYLPLTVKTIAGKRNVKGYLDGTGDAALFNGSWGIELTDDGNLYVADIFNNKIRKITPDGVVTTVKIPLRPDRTSLRNPAVIKIAKDGTMNILALEYTYNFKYRVWIVKPNGELYNPEIKSNEFFVDMGKDPYEDNYWICGAQTTGNGSARGLIAKFLTVNDTLGTNPYSPDNNQIVDPQYPSITGIFCGYNGVKYLVVNQRYIYKLTKSGEFKRIFINYNFRGIYSIIANKDSRTVYVADDGRILAISNNHLQFLVGPRAPYDGRDGVGSSADVRAHHMVLSKDENTLYFTDYSHYTIRKILLK
ncbi:hypothetical protein IM792_19380 [Mucilaginibacter sp. JRF]|uniref:hypothetical protein n=1 Tax=Mucilaginibacter sp. JRF TaxID=2780088 RepID=UPI00188052E2|nr:hypothetical protein [Mucilaginibacter sp. JRF]MBE9586620.1 hypothetical protein [Mucilaginibacter sp. JRF]